MDLRVLIVSLSLWGSALRAQDTHSPTAVLDDVRLVGGAKPCAGRLEAEQQGGWEPVDDRYYDWNLTSAAAVCRRLNCGSAVSLRRTHSSTLRLSAVTDIMNPDMMHLLQPVQGDSSILEITCSDSVRLVDGNSLCSGRLEVKSDQLWSSVCEDDFDLQDAEVVCRELGCGAPSVLQGALYGEGEAPVWTKEFLCDGRESALLDCRSWDRNSCSSGKAAGLTCSEPADVRLVGKASRCGGTLEMKRRGEWKAVDQRDWSLESAGSVCSYLDCGSAVSTRRTETPAPGHLWGSQSACDESPPMKCFTQYAYSSFVIEVTCSDSIRLVDGNSLCSGRLEVKSDQLWSSVCEDGFDLQDAEVVCRELGCGAPSVLQGALYGEVEAPVWTKEIQCDGQESALLDCGSSDSAADTCSSGRAVRLTCSDPDEVRLVGGTSRCSGRLELKHRGVWRAVGSADPGWGRRTVARIYATGMCDDEGEAQQSQPGNHLLRTIKSFSFRFSFFTTTDRYSARITADAAPIRLSISRSILPSLVKQDPKIQQLAPNPKGAIHLFPAENHVCRTYSVRLVDGNSLCSGRLEVKSDQLWFSVCEDGFDLQDAEVVCRELGCGAPSVLQGALYGEVEAPMWTKEFQCDGRESAFLDCGSSDSAAPRLDTCSPGGAVRLTCSEHVRLVGEASRCAGTLEMKNQGEWRAVADWDSDWDHWSAAAVCAQMHCGSAVSTEMPYSDSETSVWWITSSCVQSAPVLVECVILTDVVETYTRWNVICTDLLARPNLSSSAAAADGGSNATQQGLQVLMGSDFSITCSTEPQYHGGSFQLVSTASGTANNRTLPAANHSAHFRFSGADHTHQGEYRCVYHVHVFSHNFSSESLPLYVTVSASVTELIIRLVVLLLAVTLAITALCLHSKARRSHIGTREEGL
ncbi:scavenger receptor cysteine-rich type 1 protein M130-like [Pempheris klunzingeri]|uniref:scavenger receptor cysteine-rich type 1 protein M130-like n=1 Tax=Pempheris klunzingeri TaxID=3127111 RepID=UPI0039810716